MHKTILFLLLMTGLLMAQQSPQYSAGVTLGSSIPTGEFADKEEGGAAAGTNFGLKAYYHYTKNISFGVSYDIQVFEYSEDFEDDLRKDLPVGAVLELEKWNFNTLLFSSKYAVPVNEKLNAFGEAYLGFAFCKSPAITAKYNGQKVFSLTSAKSPAMVFGLGGGVDYAINSQWSLDFTLGIFPVLEPEYEMKNLDGVTEKIKQKQAHMKFSLGVLYHFD